MTSRSRSQSEGEILSSDSEKAKSTQSHNSTRIDRPTRPHVSAARSPLSRSYRSRSRSPYRAQRGEKRRRDERHSRNGSRHDPRQFAVRYEGDQDRRRGNRQAAYEDLDPGHGRRSTHLTYDDGSDRMQSSKRPRTGSRSRSRSPYRRPSGLEQSQRSKQDREDEDRARRWEQYQRGLETNRKPRADQSVSARSTAPNVARPSESHAKTSSKQTSQDTQTLAGTVKADKCVGQAYAVAQTNFSTSLHAPKPKEPDIVAAAQPVLDEAAQIEERRKRREALKNRYRGGATPVRIQALHLDGDANSSASGANTAQDDATTPGTLTDTPFVYYN